MAHGRRRRHRFTYVNADNRPTTKKNAHIGSGAFSDTYRMCNEFDHRVCAVKQTRTAATEEAERLAVSPSHPNLIGYFGCRRSVRGHMWLFLELVGRGDVVHPRRDHAHRVQIITDVARGLGHLHAHNILHRDIKCTNVMVGGPLPGGRVVLGDFGHSTGLGDDGMYTLTGRVSQGRGHRVYRAAEVTGGKPYGRPSDMWSLGCMLVELVLGQTADALVGNSTAAGWYRDLATWIGTTDGHETLDDVHMDARMPDGVPVGWLRLLAMDPGERPRCDDVVGAANCRAGAHRGSSSAR